MGIKHLLGLAKRRRQDVLVITGFGGVVDDSLDVVEGKGYAANDRTQEAWGVDDENMIRDRETGRTIQVVTAWSPMPVRMFGPQKDKITKANIEALAARITDESIEWEMERQRRNTLIMWAGIVCTVLALGIVIPVLQAVFSGRLNIPFLS